MLTQTKQIVSAGGSSNYMVIDLENQKPYFLFNENEIGVELRTTSKFMLEKRISWKDLEIGLKSGKFKLLKDVKFKQ